MREYSVPPCWAGWLSAMMVALTPLLCRVTLLALDAFRRMERELHLIIIHYSLVPSHSYPYSCSCPISQSSSLSHPAHRLYVGYGSWQQQGKSHESPSDAELLAQVP